MIREFGVKNYKSILDNTVELGRFNVFIGENGCGKTNLLEAMAMAAGAVTGKLDTEELYSRGIRVAKPSITLSSFANAKVQKHIGMRFTISDSSDEPAKQTEASIDLSTQDSDDIYAKWGWSRSLGLTVSELVDVLKENDPKADAGAFLRQMARESALTVALNDFVIYNINQLALRGIQSTSKRSPLASTARASICSYRRSAGRRAPSSWLGAR